MGWEVTSENVSLWVQQRAHLEVGDPRNYRISTKATRQGSAMVRKLHLQVHLLQDTL